MRRTLIVAVLATGLLFAAAPISSADDLPAGAEGCTASANGGGPQLVYAKTCGFTAKRNGGWVSNGPFKVTIVRGGKTVVLTDATSKANCTTAFKVGDKVKVDATGSSGAIAAGNPFPAGTPSTGGTPGDYKACKK